MEGDKSLSESPRMSTELTHLSPPKNIVIESPDEAGDQIAANTEENAANLIPLAMFLSIWAH